MFGKTLVTGGNGFLGSHLVQQLSAGKLCDSIFTPRSTTFDLRLQNEVDDLFHKHGPFDTVFHLAATVGGIGPTSQHQGQFFYDNAQMGINLIHASHLHRVGKLIVMGSVCAYPLVTPLPMSESDLWNGKPEPSNASYGYAKRMLSAMLDAYAHQYDLKCAYVLMSNLYGPGDHFHDGGHVIPMLIRKMIEDPVRLDVWGTGNATRDFLYVEDAARAVVQIAKHVSKPYPINVGSGVEVSIKNLVSLLCDILPYAGKVTYDYNLPDGQPRRMLDLHRAEALIPQWKPTVDLATGLRSTIEWYKRSVT